jgi:peptide/nickel transport system permease protein
MLAFPFFLVAILIVGILGPELRNAILAVGIAKIPIFARYVRGVTLKLAQEDFIEAAQAVGANKLRIMLVHIVPNVTIPAIVLATVELASTILSVSGLSFLGLGAQPPTPEWGLMLSESRSYFQQAPHIMIFPGVFLSLLVLSINLVGDGLQLATDPRRRGS